jgi:UrcA family protein
MNTTVTTIRALAALLCLLGTVPALAGTTDGKSVTVSFRDLDISSLSGAKVLYRRIQAAAWKVCEYRGADFTAQSLSRSCFRAAVTDAVARVNSPQLTAIHTHRPPAMTAMLGK